MSKHVGKRTKRTKTWNKVRAQGLNPLYALDPAYCRKEGPTRRQADALKEQRQAHEARMSKKGTRARGMARSMNIFTWDRIFGVRF